MTWIPAERAQEVADAFYAGKQKFGKGGKKGDKGKGHPAGGDGKSVKNARGLKCYDYDSKEPPGRSPFVRAQQRLLPPRSQPFV